jgi:hypothetical protein
MLNCLLCEQGPHFPTSSSIRCTSLNNRGRSGHWRMYNCGISTMVIRLNSNNHNWCSSCILRGLGFLLCSWLGKLCLGITSWNNVRDSKMYTSSKNKDYNKSELDQGLLEWLVINKCTCILRELPLTNWSRMGKCRTGYPSPTGAEWVNVVLGIPYGLPTTNPG